jgi:hypothetical protein
MLRELRLRIRALWKRRQLERDLEDELAYHMTLRQSEARAPFGNATLVREKMRDVWTFPRLEDLWRDVSHGVRILRRTPGQTAAIIFLLAIGIGANTAIFSLLDTALLTELPVTDPKGLVILNRPIVEGTSTAGASDFSTPLFDRFRAQLTTMDLAGVGSLSNPQFKLTGGSPCSDRTESRFLAARFRGGTRGDRTEGVPVRITVHNRWRDAKDVSGNRPRLLGAHGDAADSRRWRKSPEQFQ